MDTYYHYKIYKPVGYLSQFVNNQNKRKNKLLLGELYNFHPDTMAIGRLDQDSEGLLLLTTNGKLSYKILNSGVEKEYYAQLDGQIDNTSLQNLQKGINISINGKSYLTKPCKVKTIQTPILPKAQRPIKSSGNNPTSWISVTLTEGKFRQVRKMTAAVGFPTLRLVRVRIGNETISELDVAEVLPKKEFDI
jgi:23S rRNA pseudouridine2457 synthase